MYKLVKELPNINLTSQFLLLEDIEKDIKKDWLAFCDFFISSELKYVSPYSMIKDIQNYKEKSNNFIVFNDSVKNIFGFGDEFKVLDFEFNSGIYSVIVKTNYEKLINQFIDSETKKLSNKYFTVRAILSRFLLFQKVNKKLLFPLSLNYLEYLKYDFSKLYDKSIFYVDLINSVKNDESKGRYTNIEIKNLNVILASCNWATMDKINNKDFNDLQKYCFENKDILLNQKAKSSILNKMRNFLIIRGRADIDSPTNFMNSIRTNSQVNFYKISENPFEWLSIDKEHKLFLLKSDALLYLNRLKDDGLTSTTRKKYMVAINHLLKYIINKQEHYGAFDEKSVNSLFDINNGENFHKYLEELDLAEGSINEMINIISKFLEFSGLMTSFAKRNIPKRKSNRKKITSRNAMPQEMLDSLKEILMTNPPKPNVIWDISRADTSWWKYEDIYPVQPLMLLIHLNIPIRGGQLRHLCRTKSLVFDTKGGLDRFIINTDKNVNRNELQEIPNVWPELEILKDYLKWNKEYFPYLPKYKYNGEENTPWEDIEPLFLLPNSLQPISAYQHKVYLIKLLCTYQIEMNKKFENKEISFKIKVAWEKDESNFFDSVEELNKATDTYLSNRIQIAYNIHAIRVTGITRYLDAGVNLNVLLMLTGHVDYNMIVNVYTKFTAEEKKNILQSAINKLRFDEPKDLLTNVERFMFDEIPSKYDVSNPKEIKKSFKDNGLFSMKRNASSLYEKSIDMDVGIDLASLKHPSTWFPMISGICPGVQCPEGRERKCSLCSYFITGKIFLEGVIHMANMKMASFFRLSKEYSSEKESSNRYIDSKRVNLELLVEEIMGWHQIIEKIELDIKNSNEEIVSNKLISFEEVPSELAYLENCYNAKLMGVEQDSYGLKLLTIKAIKFAKSTGKEEDIYKLIDSEEVAIDYLMNYYLDYKNKNLLPSFINKIK